MYVFINELAIMKNTTAWRVGCGDKFKFWEDAWMGGEEPLLARFPRLYSISTQQHQSIQHMGAIKDAGWEWVFKFGSLGSLKCLMDTEYVSTKINS